MSEQNQDLTLHMGDIKVFHEKEINQYVTAQPKVFKLLSKVSVTTDGVQTSDYRLLDEKSGKTMVVPEEIFEKLFGE